MVIAVLILRDLTRYTDRLGLSARTRYRTRCPAYG
jgi:hypothetical protein